MIAVAGGIFFFFLMLGRVALSKHERTASAQFVAIGSGGTSVHAPVLLSSASLRARSRSDTGFREPGEQTSDSRGERKMEVRVGERLLYLAVLSSVLCVDLVLGKYVKGIVNTKEVSVVFCFVFFFLYLFD